MSRINWYWFFWGVLVGIVCATVVKAQDQPPSLCEVTPSESTKVYESHIPHMKCSYVSLGPPTVSDAVATVTYRNTQVHGASDDTFYDLTWEGIRVTIYYTWDEGGGTNDTVEVVPEDGYYANPQRVNVPENGVQEYHLYKMLGV